jgi:hypothetical protein
VNKDDALEERYEEIRQIYLGRQPQVSMWGLVVLITKGMTAWARTWCEYGANISPMPAEPKGLPAEQLSQGSEEIVRVWAGMVWTIQEGALHCLQ